MPLAQSYSLFCYLPCIIKISSQFYARLGNFTFFRYFSFSFPLSLFPSLALSIASGANFPNLTLCTMKLGVEKALFSIFCRTITTSRENWDSLTLDWTPVGSAAAAAAGRAYANRKCIMNTRQQAVRQRRQRHTDSLRHYKQCSVYDFNSDSNCDWLSFIFERFRG